MVYVHLGLHKTATTSLQHSIFPFIDGIEYLGRDAENTARSSDLYKSIAKFCFQKERDEELFCEIINKLEKWKNRDILISDEWFTSDYSGLYGFDGACWQAKLSRLSDIVCNFEYRIFLTLRHPVEGFFSQYKEFCSVGIFNKHKSFEHYVNKSNDAKVYHYQAFNEFISSKFTTIKYFDFADLKRERFIGELEMFFSQNIFMKISHTNKKDTNEINIINPKSIRAKIIKLVIQYTPRELRQNLSNNKLYIHLRNRILKAGEKIKIDDLTSEEMLRISQKFKLSIEYYYKLFAAR